MSTAVIVHAGGPTTVLNASLAGVVEESRKYPAIRRVLGARFGLASCDFVDLTDCSAELLSDIARTTGSAIGSSRQRLADEDYERVRYSLRQRDVRWIFYTGGNGSMQAALTLAGVLEGIQVIGIPKTIDNDVAGTDHTPGYPSAARFAAFFARDAGQDNRSLPSPVMVLEVVGRNTGWVAAATSLGRNDAGDPPHLIYVPERRLSRERLLSDVEAVYRRLGRAVLTVCEGQLDGSGDAFGSDSLPHTGLAANLGHAVARSITEGLGVRARAERPGLLGRSCSAYVSDIDLAESRLCGQAAVRAAMEGHHLVMVGLQREAGEYACRTTLVPLECVAGIERGLPLEWTTENDVTSEFTVWASPLAGLVPPLARL